MKNYKNTLLMPQTDFPMKGNLGKNEINIQQKWHQQKLYQKKLKQNQGAPMFMLHDGPPYANGNLHIGHALNKILKDFIVRFHSMKGFYTPYIPGWDTHGLPIEAAVLKKDKTKYLSSRQKLLEKCQAFALENVTNQKKQFQRLGVLGDWDNPYLTLDSKFISDQVRIFGKMVAEGVVFRALKPIHWSPTLESALAEAELEYHEHQSPSIYVAFPMTVASDSLFQNACAIIWTTTPWTLIANKAIAVHPHQKYQLIDVLNKRYLVGKNALPQLKKTLAWDDVAIKIIKTYQGKEIEYLTYRNPLVVTTGFFILSEHVLDNEGTGLVHIAPGHGLEDFIVGQKYHLEVVCSIDKKGLMSVCAGKYQGLFYTKANDVIIADLSENDYLLKADVITHSHPCDWRTKKPVISLALSQWFVSLKKIKTNLLKAIQQVKWVPKWGNLKMTNMMQEREDWNISRQRIWGVPIAIFYAENEEPILDLAVTNHVANLFEQHGSEIWYEWDCQQLLPSNYQHPNSPNGIFTKELDIMDVWFDSGTSYSVIKRRYQNDVSSLYLEGNDQHRGWFNSSLITSVAAFQKSPYHTVITHGFVLDGKGQKMSKSLGNIIDPLTIASQKGADIIRLWVANTNYNFDVRINNAILNQVEDMYRKIRNTLRFMIGNLARFDKTKHYLSWDKRKPIHQAVILDWEEIVAKIIHSYQVYDFEVIIRNLFPFITNKISAFYFDFIKDILYLEKEEHLERQMVQSTIYDLLLGFLQVLTPIIPHTTSEAYSFCPFFDQEDVYLESMPQLHHYEGKHLLVEYYHFLTLRKNVLQVLEKTRQSKIINSSLQAHLYLELTKEQLYACDVLQIKEQLHQLFIVSKVTLVSKDVLGIKVEKASGYPCQRCWNVVLAHSNQNLCLRCYNILNLQEM
ncbi:isoleucine--tRNA ligase ['Fragaria x ananassa' phyllody phytoplasma]|uniref:Isoleucine--tRNA ligase n=1 Tax='Fragaria x ananassa' phyllody phytoplasma TaxID=2358428 RepID=A0ABS5K2X0_9MOLU|nr:isoleucine--tRNA ligase ['Fragaria x ananassa' phyllody phytoplasma]MBS2126242.1 isoleucine--tRNA ligase ['Fragaria x ananassa' phyllody phytoplasma]